MNPCFQISLACLTLAVSALASADAAPITFNTALPVSRGEPIIRLQYVYNRASGNDAVMTANAAVGVLAYGATPRLALFTIVPYTNKRLETPGGVRESSGFGDARLFARYTVLQQNAPGKTLRLAPFIGVEAPTGTNRQSDVAGLLPPPLQLGSGSWDVFGGIVATYATTRWQTDAQISYRENTGANGFEAGNQYRADASLQYRLATPSFGNAPGYLFAVFEANAIVTEKDQITGVANANSGGSVLILAPGIQYATRRWIAETAVQVPIAQDVNGPLQKDVTIRAGFRVNF
ncbi:MAG: transporter [Alphaproteobacteria bacterium]|nr:transporter [Alphaproteobacteria bacterium]